MLHLPAWQFLLLGIAQFAVGVAAGLWLGRAWQRATEAGVAEPAEIVGSGPARGVIRAAEQALRRMRRRGDGPAEDGVGRERQSSARRLSPQLVAACQELRDRAAEVKQDSA